MEVITIDSRAYHEIVGRIEEISYFIKAHVKDYDMRQKTVPEPMLSSRDVAQVLHVSMRTLQRMRTEGRIAYCMVHGCCRYSMKEVRRVIDGGSIRASPSGLDELTENMKLRTAGKHSQNQQP